MDRFTVEESLQLLGQVPSRRIPPTPVLFQAFQTNRFQVSRNLGIPVAFLFSDVHEDYHKTTDTADKIDLDKMRRVTRLVVRMLHDLQVDELDL